MRPGMDIVTTLLTGLGILHLLITAAAVLLCWPHRRISPGMNLVVAGLVGTLLSEVVGRFVSYVPSAPSWSVIGGSGIFAVTVAGLVSWGLVVFGLARTLVDVRRAISLAKDHRHDHE